VTLLTDSKGKCRALVADIDLGGKMDGWEVAKHAREIDPEFPVVYMSGDSAGDWAANGVSNSIMLNKPFAPTQLVTAVSQLTARLRVHDNRTWFGSSSLATAE
jgi:DNA-binding NtrC family response regulator